MKTPILVAAAIALTACASPGAAVQTAPYAAEQNSFTGWVRFSEGEFQLYADRDQVLQPFSRPCLSGAAGRDIMRMSGDLSGMRVTVTGRTQAWSRDLPGHRIPHEGSVIRNVCGGAFVVLADSIRPV